MLIFIKKKKLDIKYKRKKSYYMIIKSKSIIFTEGSDFFLEKIKNEYS